MTILFSDMEHFTSLSEGMTPPAMVRVVNRYLVLMSEPIHRNQGVIDKYIGDAIMAYWGPPFSAPDEQARLACAAGFGQLAALDAFRGEIPELTGFRRGGPRVDMRIGIATGEVVVGNIGSDTSMSYTVMGDTVNLASRLESVSKVYGTRFLVSARTAAMAEGTVVFREIDLILVEGKREPERIFEVLGRPGEIADAVAAMAISFAEGLAAYRSKSWAAAAKAFTAALAAVPEDGPSRVFIDRVARLEATPPPADWSGVWTLHQK
jgi:class 3 adenylate cyclase